MIPISGPIARHADLYTRTCGGVTTEALARDITAALDDPTCSAVVLDIDSPGGESSGIAELAAMIHSGTSRKPIVAYGNSEVCSAAYWLASACSEIVVGDMAWVGSIGTVMGYVRKDDKPGTKSYEFVSSQSPNKRPDMATEKGREVIQQVVDEMTSVFISSVAQYRDTTAEDVAENYGRGFVLVGQKAVDAGMADRIGSLEDVIAELSDPRTAAQFRPPGATAANATLPAAPSAVSLSLSPVEPQKMALSWLFRPKADGSIEAVSQTVADTSAPAPAPAPTPTPKSEAEPVVLTAKAIDLAHDPVVIALREQVAALTAKATAAHTANLETRAVAFVQSEHAAGRIFPPEATHLYKSYLRAARDDDALPVATGELSRVATLAAQQAARPKHGLYAEQISPDALPEAIRLLGQRPDTGPDRDNPNAPVSAARTEELLKKFPAGVKLLAQEKAGK